MLTVIGVIDLHWKTFSLTAQTPQKPSQDKKQKIFLSLIASVLLFLKENTQNVDLFLKLRMSRLTF